jgi:sugar phosphate isomerase/epimerase
MEYFISINGKEFLEFGAAELVRLIKNNDKNSIIKGAEVAIDSREDEQKEFGIDLASAMSANGWMIQLHADNIYGAGENTIIKTLQYYNLIAEKCGTKTKVTFHPAEMQSIRDSIHKTRAALDYINNIVEKKRLDLDILLENLNTYGGKPRCNIEQIFEILRGSIKNRITLDLGHYFFDYRINDIQLEKEFSKKIGNVHIHDIDGKRRDHQPFYYNNVKLEKIRDILNGIGYSGSIVAEISLCFLKGDSLETRLQEYISQVELIERKLDFLV